MKKVLGLSLVLFAFPVFATDISYNYLQVGYQQVGFDDGFVPGVDVDGDGYDIEGAFELGNQVFVKGAYSQTDFDFGVKLDTLSLGLGYHVGIADRLDFYGTLSAVRIEASAIGIGDQDDEGYAAEIGLRGMLGDRLELSGSLGYVDLGDGADGTEVGAGLQYYFSDSVSLGVAINVDEDVTTYGAGVRLYF